MIRNHLGVLFLSCLLLGSLSACISAETKQATAHRHPLDPLTAEEINTCVTLIRKQEQFPTDAQFATVALHEPAKEWLLAYHEGTPFKREAEVVLLDKKLLHTYEVVVDVTNARMVQWREIPQAHPQVLLTEFDSIPDLVRHDKQWQEALIKRGIRDFENVQIDAWAFGVLPAEGLEHKTRLARALSYYRPGTRNAYGRPIEGVVAIIDMSKHQVIKIIDTGVIDLAEKNVELRAPEAAKRPAVLLHQQPFQVRGQEITWKSWRFRFALHPREGLVIYSVAHKDGDRWRPIMYRASLSEMVVPYGDPDETWAWRNAFDEGEYGVGRLANTLTRGTDVPYDAALFDSVFADDDGKSYVQPESVAVYERDGGVLWKHYDYDSGHNETQRGRDLVVSYFVTVGNYDYGFAWIFKEDGTIELSANLTGIMLPKGVGDGSCDACPDLAKGQSPAETTTSPTRYGHLVAKRVVAPNHQHIFNFRLDMDIDGPANSLVEINTRALPMNADNPFGNAFVMNETLFKTEQEAARDMSFSEARRWKIFNPESKSSIGHLAGYVLIPGENSPAYQDVKSPIRGRAGFVDHVLWTTAYNATEAHAAGDYPNQGKPGEGLRQFISNNDAIVRKDLVLWYTFGVTHLPRPEDWPVMPVHATGFKLVPSGFFRQNPALQEEGPEQH